jgi:very-short-patch-repair endonuclease
VVSENQRQQAEQLFDSPFEKAVYERLVAAGYRVRPQVPAGAFRIDLVVLGGQGRKLAVECDGDRFHGLDQWPADMARQRTLERVGWTFWRCFASSWYRDPEASFADLVTTLTGLGIEPGAAPDEADDFWVEHRVIAPREIVDTPKKAKKSRKAAKAEAGEAVGTGGDVEVEMEETEAETPAPEAEESPPPAPLAHPRVAPLVFDDPPA